MPTEIATPDLLKNKAFWHKGSEWIISIHDSTIKVLSSSSNYKVDVVMWPNFGRLLQHLYERSYHKSNYIGICSENWIWGVVLVRRQ